MTFIYVMTLYTLISKNNIEKYERVQILTKHISFYMK